MSFCYERLMNVRCPDCVDGDACDDCQAITEGVKEIDRLRVALATIESEREELKIQVERLQADLWAVSAQGG